MSTVAVRTSSTDVWLSSNHKAKFVPRKKRCKPAIMPELKVPQTQRDDATFVAQNVPIARIDSVQACENDFSGC